MALVLGTWIVLLAIFATLGFYISKLLQLSFSGIELFFGSVWIGWSLVIAFLQLWHLLSPINLPALLLLIFFSFLCFLLIIRSLRLAALKNTSFSFAHGLLILFFVLGIVLVTNRALGVPPTYDAGLYHLNSIRWATTYSITPGLGNLHGRLAFNSSYFLYLALLDAFPYIKQSYHVGTGLLFLLLNAQLLSELPKLRTIKMQPVSLLNIFAAILIVPSLFLLFTQAPTTLPDLPVFAIGIISSLYLGKLIFEQNSDARNFSYLFLILILSMVGITIKLSYLAMAGLSIIVAAGSYYWKLPKKHGHRFPRVPTTSLIIPISVIVIIMGLWIIRAYILSGYPFYPANIGGLPLSWRIPENQVEAMERIIRSWARWPNMPPDEVLSSWRWLVPWSERMLVKFSTFVIPVMMIFFGFLFTIILQRRMDRLYRWKTFLFLLPSAGAALFWFFTAPDPRFAGASLFILGAGLLSASISLLPDRISRLTVYFFLCLCSTMILVAMFRSFTNPQKNFSPPLEVPLITKTTESGIDVFLPQSGDQCWDAPLPCTPFLNPQLRLRNDADLSSGFTLNVAEDQ